MNWFPLPIFPEGSLASSVVTTVWVGVLVFCVMNLRFGWPFSGLVVPGYLVPLLIVKPWSAAVVVVEALVTFVIVRWVIEGMPRIGWACRPFGRDRFMAMIIVSAFVRLVFDAWLLPTLGAWANASLGWNLDYRNNLQSIGLIVICLAANQLWKTGIRRGAMAFGCNLLITYVIIRFVLMEFTNFSISRLGFLYEDVASSIFASPKAYIILITSAMLASRVNLRYGWDFHGVLIPALLALQWYEPAKILTSFVEAGFVLGVSVLAMRMPGFRGVTMEGARKMLLFFTVSFAYKMVVGFGVGAMVPEAKVSDYYGFGYLVPTLIALKMHDLGRVVHQVSVTLQISLLSVGAANAVGLLFLSLPLGTGEPGAASAEPVPVRRDSLDRVARGHFVRAHGVPEAAVRRPDAEEAYRFERGLADLLEYGESGDAGLLGAAAGQLGRAGFSVEEVDDRFLVLADAASRGGLQFVINRRPDCALAVAVPLASGYEGAFDAGLTIFEGLGARAFVTGPPDEADSAHPGEPSFQQIFRASVGGGYLEVRGGERTTLLVDDEIPPGLDLGRLEAICGPFEACWTKPEAAALPASAAFARAGGGLMLVDESGLLARTVALPAEEIVTGTLTGFLRREGVAPAESGSGAYRPATAAELRYLDRHLMAPLFRLTADDLSVRLPALANVADGFGFRLRLLNHGGDRLLHLQDPAAEGRFWGEIVVRLPECEPASGPVLAFEIPSRSGDGSLLGFAAERFESLRARALIMAGSTGATNPDGSSLLTVPANRDSFFNLAHQALLRSAVGQRPAIVQCRAFAPSPAVGWPDADVLWAVTDRVLPRRELDLLLAPVRGDLEGDGVRVVDVSDSPDTAAFVVGGNVQSIYMDMAGRAAFAVAWLSPGFRALHRPAEDQDERSKLLRALGIEVECGPIESVMDGAAFAACDRTRLDELKDALAGFRATGDILRMSGILTDFQEFAFRGIVDPDRGQACLVVSRREDGAPVLVANLARTVPDRTVAPGSGEIGRFLRAGAAWLNPDPHS